MRNYVRSRRGGVAKEGALARGTRPPGASSGRRRKNRRQNARREAKGGEGGPKGHREHLAERRGAAGWIGGRGGEEERSEKTNGGVKKWKDISPGAVRGRVGDGSRIK
jgi:hypothetical protein